MKTMMCRSLGLCFVLAGFTAAGSSQLVRADTSQLDCSVPAASGSDFVLISSVKIKPDQVAAFESILLPYVEQTRKEEGNLEYFADQSTDDPTEFAMYEHWGSDEARATHLANAYTVQFFSQAGPMFEPGYPARKKFVELKCAPRAGAQ